MADRAERSAAEREAARLDRERRRAGRTGDGDGDGDGMGMPDSPSDDGDVRYVGDPDGSVSEAHTDDFDDLPEPAAGTRRVSRRERPAALRPTRPAPAGPARKRRDPRPGRSHSRLGRVAALIALIVGAVAIWFLVELFQPFHGQGHGRVTVTIPPHSSSSKVADLLARDGVISSSFFFELRATLAGERGQMRSGTYHLRLDMSYGSVLKLLTTAPPPVPTTELTISDGHTRRQVSALLREQGIGGSYVGSTRHSRLLSPRSYGAPASTPSLEGFLFPDTYQLVKPVKISQLIADQLENFKAKWRTVRLGYARSRGLTPYDVLIIASLIEGEAQLPHDLPLVASVIYNRLHDGMPLQLDSTLRYASGNYSRPVTESQLHAPGPYNTYLNKGLPPTPINSPGMAQIQAAAHPAHTNYLFFVTKACGNGALAFAATYQQFQIIEQQYSDARKRLGRSPTRC